MLYKGGIVRMLREQKGMSQEELADGICSIATLSKIENGMQAPGWSRFEAFLEKLGEDPRKYTFAMDKNEYEAIQLEYDISELFDQRKYKKAETLVNKLEELKNLDVQSEKFVCFSRVFLDYANGTDIKDTIQDLEDILNSTLEQFKEDKLNNVFLTKNEIRFLNFLAVCYASTDKGKSIKLLYAIKNYIEARIIDKVIFANQYVLIAYNLSKQLGLVEEHEEALEVAEQGIKWANRYSRGLSNYAGLILNKACCMIETDTDLEEAIELLQLSYSFFKFRGSKDNCKAIITYATDKNIDLKF